MGKLPPTYKLVQPSGVVKVAVGEDHGEGLLRVGQQAAVPEVAGQVVDAGACVHTGHEPKKKCTAT